MFDYTVYIAAFGETRNVSRDEALSLLKDKNNAHRCPKSVAGSNRVKPSLKIGRRFKAFANGTAFIKQ